MHHIRSELRFYTSAAVPSAPETQQHLSFQFAVNHATADEPLVLHQAPVADHCTCTRLHLITQEASAAKCNHGNANHVEQCNSSQTIRF